MNPDATKQLMQRFTEFINTADEHLANELISNDAVFHVPTQTAPLQGPAGYIFIIAMMRGGFPDVHWTLEELISEGDKSAARFTMRGTHRGTFLGIPPTEKRIEVQALNLYRWADRKIVEERGQPDMLGLMQQIGALPAP